MIAPYDLKVQTTEHFKSLIQKVLLIHWTYSVIIQIVLSFTMDEVTQQTSVQFFNNVNPVSIGFGFYNHNNIMNLDPNGNLSTNGTITSLSDATIDGTLSTTSDATIGGFLAVSGDLSFSGNLTVDGTIEVHDDINAALNVNVGGNQ